MRDDAGKYRADVTGDHEASVVYPHQLFLESPALSQDRPVVLAEDPWFFTRFRFHAQKLVLHRATMKRYRDHLAARGFRVEYIEAADLDTSTDLYVRLGDEGVSEVHLCDPLENGLIEEIQNACSVLKIRLVTCESPMFLCSRGDIAEFYREGRKLFFTEFYRAQRKRRNIMLEEDGRPVGKRWTFDTRNRDPLPRDLPIPRAWQPGPNEYVQEAISYVKEHFPGARGTVTPFFWPVTFEDANRWFEDFLVNRLAFFGRFEDAIHRDEPVLFHAAVSPLLNIGLLTPRGVVDATLEYASDHEVPVESLEGFIRQVIGWREFVRAVYLQAGGRERASNILGLDRPVPPCFWDASTGLEPVDATIRRVLATGYCHHIERLMVLGNIMLLAGFHPGRVCDWFSELFIDAYDWVMVPNVYGMSQFADGGMMSTKPYISGSRYILKMGNYHRGPWCDLWDALYWRFLYVHRDLLAQNPRMAPFTGYIVRMQEDKREQLLLRAEQYLVSIGECAGPSASSAGEQ